MQAIRPVLILGVACLLGSACGFVEVEPSEVESTEPNEEPGARPASPADDFEAAKRTNDPDAFDAFLALHPEAPQRRLIESERAERAFERARREGTELALDEFRARFPDSPKRAALEAHRAERAFAAAERAGSAEAYREFALHFEASALALEAAARADALDPPDRVSARAGTNPRGTAR